MIMDAQRWQRAGTIFDKIVEVSSDERPALLDLLCGNDPELRHDVAALLAADAAATALEAGIDSARAVAAAEWIETDERENARAGARIGPWRVLDELGRGGMGVVWLAERADGAFEQRAALKLILRGMDSDAVQVRFLRERNILARLEHPHIARLLDGGVAGDGRPYFAMEFVDGKPLLNWCAESSTKLEERIRIFLDVCAAVQFAHGRLVVHRDIKPANILVTAAGEAKLLDFGIAALLDDSGNVATIDAQHRPLTPAYAAPEQLRGEPATTASDIYALGCVIYELLTGRRPLAPCEAPTLEQMRRAQETTDPAAPSRVADAPVSARRLRGDLDTIVLKALQRDPARRYATVEAFAEDLRRFLGGMPIAARRDNAGYRLRKFVGRHRVGVAATALGMFALMGALAFAVWQAHAKAREAETSQQVTQFLAGLFKGADPELSRGASLSAEDLLDQATQRLRTDARMQADVHARLLDTVATTYTSLGLYDRALPLAQQSLDLRRDGAGDAERAESLFVLGRILRLKASYADAAPLLDEALRLRRRSLAPDDPAIIESLRERGALLRARGEFAEAGVAFAEALQLAQRHYGADSIESAAAEDDQAANLDDMGRRVDAEAAYRHALTTREKLRGEDDADVATSLVNLGVHLDESGDYDQAVPLLERAAAIRKKIFGAEHPLVGGAELALAGVYESQNRLDECERMTQDALAIFRKSLPEDHPKISESLNLLGIVRQERRDFTGAIPLMQEVLARFRKTLGEDHPDTLTAQSNLAYALGHSGRFAEAERLQRDVLARKHPDNGQLVDATDCENLAGTLVQQGKYAEAVAYARRAVDIHKSREGDQAANTAIALRGLAGAEELNGATADAERDFRAALAIGEALTTKQKITTYEWKIPLADFLVGAGRCADAVPLLDAAIEELGADARRHDPTWQPEAQLLLGECRGAAGAAQRRASRAVLRALPGIDADLYPTARTLLVQASR